MNTSVRSAASQAGNHPLLENGARLGFAASGLLHVLIAWVTLQLAWGLGGGGKQADEKGALSTLAGNPLGSVLLWVTVVGFALLAVWQVTEAIARGETGDRVKAAGKAVVYGVLGWTAYTVVERGSSGGSGGGSGGSPTARLLAEPYGPALVVVAGLVVIGVGVYHVVKGWTARFLRDLREHPGQWVVRAGRIGYVAKGVALGLVGGLLVTGATSKNAADVGLDEALRTLLDLPLGKVLLTLVGLGFGAYGVYSFGRARYGRV